MIPCHNRLSIRHWELAQIKQMAEIFQHDSDKLQKQIKQILGIEIDHGYLDVGSVEVSEENRSIEVIFTTSSRPPTSFYEYLVANNWFVEASYKIPDNSAVGIYKVWPTLTNDEYEYDFDDEDWRETAIEEADDEKLIPLLDEAYEEWQNNS